jgi:group I intron endonuclease
VTKKQYVGQTLCKDVETRWRQHKRCEKNTIGRYLLAAYKKYGIEAFRFQVICICFDKDCNKFEEDYIKKFDTLAPNGYNLQAGGKNSRQHPETIRKRVDKLKGRKYGPPSDATKKKISDSHQGIKNPNFGKKITDDRRAKLSEAMKNIWEERRNNGTFEECVNKTKQHLPSKNGLISNKKRVGKYDDTGKLIEEYESTTQAGLKNNIHHTVISKVCRGVNHYKKAAGFIWKFISDQTLVS